MTTLIFSNSFGNDWPPDAFEGGTITSRSAHAMTYTSFRGYTITLSGSGLAYDDDGLPSGGRVTGVLVVKAALTLATYTGVSVDFARSGMSIFGFDRDNGGHQNPDPYGFFQSMMGGNDAITGSADHDDLRGGTGNDSINSGGGGDYVGDEGGNDTYNGGDDWDTLGYDEANFRWDSFRGVNLDALTGIAQDCFGFTDHFSNFEQFKDSAFSDTLKGSNIAEEDFQINRGNDIVDGRGGMDYVIYDDGDRWGAHRGININLATGIAIDSWNGTDTLTNVEGVIATRYADTMIGSIRDEVFSAGAGKDTINMAGGFDQLAFWNVGNNNDGGHGIIIDLTAGKNILDDGYGNIENALGVERFTGSRFGDNITGNDGMNGFWGNDGNDTIGGGNGEDDVNGEWGNDRIFAGGGNDHISGGGDNDTLTGNGGFDNFNFNWALGDGGVDTITDFEHSTDNLWIDSHWGGGLSNDMLAANQFRSGAGVTMAATASQRVIYNTTTGDLFFDADGAGGAAAVRFAVLSNLAGLTFEDIHVFL